MCEGRRRGSATQIALLRGLIFVLSAAAFGSLQLRADQTTFTGTLSASGIMGGSVCPKPGPFTTSGTLTGALQPSLASLAANGGTASGVFIADVSGTGCDSDASGGGGTVTATVSPGGATTFQVTVADPVSPCTLTLTGTTTAVSGNALPCFSNVVSGTATISLTAQTVTQPAGTLRVAPSALQFIGVAGGGATPAQTLAVINDTGFQTSATGMWNGTATSSVNGSVNPLQAVFIQTGGSFTGLLGVPDGSGGLQALPIAGTVLGASFSFSFSGGPNDTVVGNGSINGNTISGNYVERNPNSPDNGTFTFTRQTPQFTPVPTLSWTTQATTVSGGAWLNVQPASGSSGAGLGSTITVSAQTANLQPGQYSGQILISSSGAANSPLAVTVLLTVLPATNTISPQTRPTGLVFVTSGTTVPPAQSVQIATASSSSSQVSIAISTSVGTGWLTCDKATAPLSNSTPVSVNISTSTTGLAAGVYRGQVTLTFSDGSPQQVIPVLLVIVAAGPAPATDPPVAAACNASTLLAVDRTLGTNFSSAASWPTTLEALVLDDCGVFATSATVLATFSNGDPPVTLQSLGNGTYQATWRPVNPSASVTVTVTASKPPLTAAVVTLSGKVTDNPTVPAIFAGGMVSAASYNGARLPPGAIIAVFGKNLAQTGAAASLPLPTALGGVTLTAAGKDLPLFYTSTGQVNAQLPSELAAGTRVAVIARATSGGNTVLSVPEIITVGPTAPGIFSVSQDGKGQGVIVDASNRLVDGKQTTATAGQVIVIYCTGLGATVPAVPSGQAAPGSPLAQLAVLPTVVIGGIPAQVQFAGMTPGLVGLFQINVVVPAGPVGATVPVLVNHQGVASNTVTIAVR